MARKRKKKKKILYYIALNPHHFKIGISPQVLTINEDGQVRVTHVIEKAYKGLRDTALEQDRRIHSDNNLVIGAG